MLGTLPLCQRHIISVFGQFVQPSLDHFFINVEGYLVPHSSILFVLQSSF